MEKKEKSSITTFFLVVGFLFVYFWVQPWTMLDICPTRTFPIIGWGWWTTIAIVFVILGVILFSASDEQVNGNQKKLLGRLGFFSFSLGILASPMTWVFIVISFGWFFICFMSVEIISESIVPDDIR
ncbi:hypothetical protein HN954_04760 [bacterium]|jgi:hypothetical protein|nr:hypothetical protein [bacterium]MBT6996707.1 hypothetical protein [bacterium]MBT7772675.1 hypothetical protein [bacterium]